MRRFFSVYDTKNRLYRVKEERLLEYKLTSPSQQHPERNEIIELFFKDVADGKFKGAKGRKEAEEIEAQIMEAAQNGRIL